ncbi:MAG: dinitrogenase iron-molybdenum cofactor [Kamptonema sp. SIO4C4]|nr:dinitrogenase iron-molybdenum cofactor [Kamptonema sp. SIO4C4]
MVQTTVNPKQAQKWRVAVASKTGKLVDVHFGHASSFDIYDVDEEQAEFIEKRHVNPYCHGAENTPGDLDEILQTLADCQAVLVSRIGIGPDDRLNAAGIAPIQTYETVETAVLEAWETVTSRQSPVTSD